MPTVDIDMFDSILDESVEEIKKTQALWKSGEEEVKEDEVVVDKHEKELFEQGFDKYGKPLDERTRRRRSSQDNQIRTMRLSDKRDIEGRVRASYGKACFVQRPACEGKLAVEMFERIGNKPSWAVEACVLLRAGGLCEVCGEVTKKDRKVLQIEPNSCGGYYTEDNCLMVCRHCAECWFPYKSFNRFLGIEQTIHTLSVAVMLRRQNEFHGVKILTPVAFERFKSMREIEEHRTDKLRTSGLVSLNRSLNEEKEV